MKKAAISTIASSISSADTEIIPFLGQITPILHELVFMQDTSMNIGMKAEAIISIGKIALATSKRDSSLF